MKDTLVVRGLVILVLVVGAIFLFKSGGSPNNLTENNTQTPTTPNGVTPTPTPVSKPVSSTPVSGMQTSLGGIFSQKGNYQCDYTASSQQGKSTNTIYFSDGKMRGEFRSTASNGVSTNVLFVYDGSYLYTWTEGMSKGVVTQPKTLSELPGIIPEDITSGRVLGSGINNVGWNCHAWSKVPSLLAKPTYVTFN